MQHMICNNFNIGFRRAMIAVEKSCLLLKQHLQVLKEMMEKNKLAFLRNWRLQIN